ncbi:MAG: hypothetical protein V4456_13515 [Bacteroidota bacterium]
MKSITELLKKHPLALIFYIIYTCLCIQLIFLNADKNSAIHGPDGGLPGAFISLIGVIFIFINLINIIFNKAAKAFYLMLSLIVIIQAFTILNW